MYDTRDAESSASTKHFSSSTLQLFSKSARRGYLSDRETLQLVGNVAWRGDLSDHEALHHSGPNHSKIAVAVLRTSHHAGSMRCFSLPRGPLEYFCNLRPISLSLRTSTVVVYGS